MKKTIISIFLLPLLCICVLAGCNSGFKSDSLAAADIYPIYSDKLLMLDGHWQFHSNSLTVPAADEQGVAGKGYNDPVERYMADDRPCVTYSLTLPPAHEQNLGLYVKSLFTAYSLYDNGQLLAANGQVSCSWQNVKPRWGSRVIRLQDSPQPHHLVLQMSVAPFRFNDFRAKILLGEFNHMKHMEIRRTITESIILGSILILGFFNFVFFLSRRADKTPLYFSMLCFGAALFIFVYGQNPISLIFPDISFSLVNQLTVFSIYWMAMVFVIYGGTMMNPLPVFFRWLVWGSSVTAIIFAVFFSPEINRVVFFYYRIGLFSFAVYAIYDILRNSALNLNFILTVLAGLLILVDYVASLIMYDLPDIYPVSFSGLFFFTLLNSAYLARRLGVALEDLQKANNQKEILLSELYHRVKNNLQIILSMLWMQRDISEEVVPVIEELGNRIKTVARVHDDLYIAKDLGNIDLVPYFETLVNNIVEGSHIDKEVETDIKVDSITLDMDQMIACGLIINELITNSFKYAFAESQRDARVSIYLTAQSRKRHLTVRDNGKGYPEQKNGSAANSMGLNLVNELAQAYLQTEGVFSYDNGARFDITF